MTTSSSARTDLARAWVESPLQMVSALEASAAGLLGPSVDVVYRTGITPLAELAARLGTIALPAGTTVTPESTRSLWRHGQVRAVGDAFSGAVQARGLLGVRRPLVVLDDGLATLHLLRLLTAADGRYLVRARAHPGLARRTLASAARSRLLSLADAGLLTVFTALPVPDGLADAFRATGGRLVGHSFAWSASLREPELHGAGVVVVGSAMASDGLVDPDAYAAWVHEIADAGHDEVVYIPHRRETPAITAAVADRDSIRVERGPWPVEVSLRCLAPGSVVHCLPSTPLLTLRSLLADAGVELVGSSVPDWWWTPHASARFRASVRSIAGHA
ncbi:hypothetical protein ACT17Q_05415 [Cellulomonas sp. CW35]|uniref:hypothetical protein n=1 Tax=Cellulomonas sp. CW35 TaxID=3458249 RepID=UPI0040331DA3